jgi:hypothetical protein
MSLFCGFNMLIKPAHLIKWLWNITEHGADAKYVTLLSRNMQFITNFHVLIYHILVHLTAPHSATLSGTMKPKSLICALQKRGRNVYVLLAHWVWAISTLVWFCCWQPAATAIHSCPLVVGGFDGGNYWSQPRVRFTVRRIKFWVQGTLFSPHIGGIVGSFN